VLILTGTTILILFLHTSLSPAIPVIADEFGVDQTLAAWVMSVYMISGAVMSILIGNFSDAFGAKRMLVIMMLIYAVTTALAGFVQDINTLLVIRALQGIAIANTPIALKIVRDLFPPGKFSIGQSIVTSAYSAGMGMGVVLGPIIVASYGWQSIFYMCAPIAAILLFFSWRGLPVDESKKIIEHSPTQDQKNRRSKVSIDLPGTATMTVTLVAFLLAFTNASSGEPITFIVPIIVGAVSLVLFVIIENKVRKPLVPLKLLTQPAIFLGNVSMLMFGIVQYIILTAVPQLGAAPSGSGLGLDPEAVGLLQLPMSLAVMIFGPVFGVMLAKTRGLNTKLLVPSMATISISFLLITLFHSTGAEVGGSLFLFGLAAALLPVTLLNIIIALIPREFTGISAASSSDMRIIGGAIGPVIATLIMSSTLVSIDVNGTTSEYPSQTAFSSVFLVGLIMSVLSTILVALMHRPAVKALKNLQKSSLH
jgi:MFS family permease